MAPDAIAHARMFTCPWPMQFGGAGNGATHSPSTPTGCLTSMLLGSMGSAAPWSLPLAPLAPLAAMYVCPNMSELSQASCAIGCQGAAVDAYKVTIAIMRDPTNVLYGTVGGLVVWLLGCLVVCSVD